MGPHRDSADSLAAELATVTRERDALREQLAAERRGEMSMRSYVLMLSVLFFASLPGVLLGHSAAGVLGFAAGAGLLILWSELRRPMRLGESKHIAGVVEKGRSPSAAIHEAERVLALDEYHRQLERRAHSTVIEITDDTNIAPLLLPREPALPTRVPTAPPTHPRRG